MDIVYDPMRVLTWHQLTILNFFDEGKHGPVDSALSVTRRFKGIPSRQNAHTFIRYLEIEQALRVMLLFGDCFTPSAHAALQFAMTLNYPLLVRKVFPCAFYKYNKILDR